MGNPHVLTIPYPAQGHVIPLLELSHCLVEHGIKVTFVNTDFIHKRVLNALGDKASPGDGISLVSIPDGLEPEQDRNDLGLLSLTIGKVMSGKLEELIERINSSGQGHLCYFFLVNTQVSGPPGRLFLFEAGPGVKVTCVIADGTLGWSLDVAEKLGLPRASFCPASAATLTSVFSIPKLLEDGVTDENGTPLKKEKIQLAPNMLSMNPADFFWACVGDKTTDKIMFDIAANNCRAMLSSDRIVCNSVYEFEAGTFTYFPNILPIGPLLVSNRLEDTIGNFWPEDSSCMKWLDQQPPNSVVYVAFGSFTVFDRTQFQELALGLELSDSPSCGL